MGTGGMTGMASALAVDPATVPLAGTLVDGTGKPLGGAGLTIVEELPPDGGIAAFPVTTAPDGSFKADLFAWGTAEAPASVTIKTAPNTEITVPGESCTQTWGVTVLDARSLALSEAAPEPLTVTATTTLLGEVCGTTGTPGGNGAGGGGGGARPTPPETDVRLGSRAAATDRAGTALTIGFVLGLLLAAGFLVPRPGSRRRS